MAADPQSPARRAPAPTRWVEREGVSLAIYESGEGIPVVLAHGLTATHHYVLMGSRALERSGHRVVSYDARGHGRSTPSLSADAYCYPELVRDLEAVLDALAVERAVLAGASMGAHTILGLAMQAPERVAALALITPAYDPVRHADAQGLARWDALAAGLREGGVEGFVAAYGDPGVPPAWRETVLAAIRQRLSQHEHPQAVADALSTVPRSRPFEDLHALEEIEVPVLVVGDRDEVDPGHPLEVAAEYVRVLPRARLVVEDPGRSPLAWQGGQLSKHLAELAAEAR